MKHIIYLLTLLPAFGQAQRLYIAPGAQLVVNNAPSLVLNNVSLVNNGSFAAGNSTVVFTGTSRLYIGGDNPTAFYTLTVHAPSNEVQLNTNTFVTNRMAMDSGNLQLNTYTLNLGATGFISGERNGARITGTDGGAIVATALLNAPHAVNPGNTGVEITSDANLGTTTVTRTHRQQSNNSGQTGIQRYFDIVPSYNSAAPVTLRFYYFDDELAGNTKNTLSLFSGTPGQDNWAARGKDNSDDINNWILKSNVPVSQRFTLAVATDSRITGSSMLVYPNPSRDAFTVRLFSEKEKDLVVRLQSQWGQILETKTIHCQAGNNTIEWNISKYAAGTYLLVFEGNDVQHTKIVKQ